MSKIFQSTEQLYGVSPTELAEMKYKDALLLMRKGLIKRKGELSDAMFKMYEYDPDIEMQMKKVIKAIKLTDLRIDEIKEKKW